MRRSADVYRECAARGLSKSETARELGVSVQAVVYMAQQYDIFFRDGRDKG
jgi:predicted transcriptional regulator